ncbi:Inosine-5'-monophosphate dehydrogenase [uncultured archaeon]|nr:Inosine-5'-monophosphate dehydrogenase [uncultured archaeon]
METQVFVGDVMSGKLVVIQSNSTAKDCALKLKKTRSDELFLKDSKGNLTGIITKTDVLIKGVCSKNGLKTKSEKLSSKKIVSIKATADVQEAAKLMNKYGIKRLLVTSNEKPIGVIRDLDLIRASPALLDLVAEENRVKPEYFQRVADGVRKG